MDGLHRHRGRARREPRRRRHASGLQEPHRRLIQGAPHTARFAEERSAARGCEPEEPAWLARIADHIPDPGKHRVRFYGHYACRSRGARRAEEEWAEEGCEPPHTEKRRKRCPPSWARLIHKVYHADPLVCRQCGGKLKITAYVSDEISVKRILAELGLSPPEEEKPPPIQEVVRVPVDEQARS